MNKKAFLSVAIVGVLGLASCSGTPVVSQSSESVFSSASSSEASSAADSSAQISSEPGVSSDSSAEASSAEDASSREGASSSADSSSPADSSADSSASQPSSSEAESEFEKWKKSADATDYDGDGKIDEKDYAVFLWLYSDDARDLDGDRKINYADYVLLEAFKTWKKSAEAEDLNGDSKIDIDDYLLYQKFLTWKESTDGADLDGDGSIDYADYLLYLPFAEWLAGDEAIDIDGDGKIDYSDYVNSNEFNAWRSGSDAYDYDENGEIEYADYVRYKEFNAWLSGTDARDYDENGTIDYADYLTHLAYIAWKNSDQAADLDGDSEITYEDYVISLQPPAREYYLPEGDPTSEVKIQFWHCLGSQVGLKLQSIVDAFNTEWKGKYKVNSVKLANSYDDLAGTIKTKLMSGEVPALTIGFPNTFSSYITNNVANSWIYPLDNFINDPNDGYTPAELADFVPGFLSEGMNYHFSGTWSMPMYQSTEMMYCNASYMAGLNPQNKAKFAGNSEYSALADVVESAASKATDEQLKALKDWVVANDGYAYDIPQKWDDMMTLAREMADDRTAAGVSDTFYPVGYDSDANMLITQFAERGIPYTENSEEANEDPSKHYVFNNDEAKTFLGGIVQDIKDKLLITGGLLSGQYTSGLFLGGQCAMTVASTGGSAYYDSQDFAVRVAPVPYYGDTPKYIQQGPSVCFFDNFDPFVHKGAWLFYKAMAEGQANAELALSTSYEPIRNSSYETEAYQSYIAQCGEGIKYDALYRAKDLLQYRMTSPVFPGADTARSEIGNVIKRVISQKYSVANALQMAYNICAH